MLDVLDLGVFTVDEDLRITSFNRAAEQITGHRADEVIGARCAEVFRTNLCDQVCPIRQSIRSRQAVRSREISVRSADGRVLPISVSTAPLVTADGRLLGGVEVFRDMSQIVDLRRQLEEKYQLNDIIGRSPAMQKIFELLPLLADSDSTVLVTGPSGTGKELISRTIHNIGPRADAPFVAVNCAAVPDALLESELFGYKAGAFTDAKKDKPGRIAVAEGGTLLLDEVGDLHMSTQAKVLRFLENRTYEPLGSNQPVTADIRLFAATNRDLHAMVEEGSFRKDLFFRLNVIEIELPPLAERVEDLPLLIEHFLRRFRASTGHPIEGFSSEAMARLLAYDFPGNIRELENIVERAFVLCREGWISLDHLPPMVRDADGPAPRSTPSLETAEVEAIQDALQRHEGNRTHAARDLGIHRSTLIRKIRRFGIS